MNPFTEGSRMSARHVITAAPGGGTRTTTALVNEEPPSRPRARLGDILRAVAASLLGVLRGTLRRLAGRPLRPGWTFGFELLVAGYRGTWSLMPKIGSVRWRNLGETLSPLRTDGLEPRYVRYEGEPTAIHGAWLEPPGADGPVLLYLHGGGFFYGSLRSHGDLIGALARAARARTLALEYRLAPEHPAPAALEDALSAYRQLLADGVPPHRIVVAGDSAGGTLVINTLLALRDRGGPLPAAGVAICPWVDLANSGASFQANSAFDFVGEEHCRLAAIAYLGGRDPRQPSISPLFADLSGLPPLLVQAGAAEALVDQIRAFSARAAEAGVDVRLSVYEDMVHVWHMMRAVTPEAQRAIDEVGGFVRTHVAS
jgi:monoterpene epsilon-lactone hydrolase